jgi:hypothetical protein
MRKKEVLLIITLSFLIVLPLAAQEGERERTVEELYLENIDLQILREQAFSDDRVMKLNTIDQLEELIEAGKATDGHGLIMEFLAMEGINRRVREKGRLINYFPEVRRRAANLLGRMTGEQAKINAKNALLTVLVTEDEPMVMAEAAYALGILGLNEGNEVVYAITYTLAKQDPDKPDGNLAYAICLALEKIARANNGIKDPDAYRTLVRIAQGSYIETVKRKAMQTLNEMRKYQ